MNASESMPTSKATEPSLNEYLLSIGTRALQIESLTAERDSVRKRLDVLNDKVKFKTQSRNDLIYEALPKLCELGAAPFTAKIVIDDIEYLMEITAGSRRSECNVRLVRLVTIYSVT